LENPLNRQKRDLAFLEKEEGGGGGGGSIYVYFFFIVFNIEKRWKN